MLYVMEQRPVLEELLSFSLTKKTMKKLEKNVIYWWVCFLFSLIYPVLNTKDEVLVCFIAVYEGEQAGTWEGAHFREVILGQPGFYLTERQLL